MDLPIITKIEDLEAEVRKVYLIPDTGIIRVLCATVIANKLKLDPVWLMIVASSSGGKSELINALNGLPYIHPISDVTMNTFASGFKGKPGEETSLLWKANYGILAFKDFTSIISKDKEAKKAIMAQLREVYDGQYNKETGNGKAIAWKGKIGAIAGATEMIYESLADLSAMGDRFIMYSMEMPDRREMSLRVFDNVSDMAEKREHIQKCFTSYITYVLERVDPNRPQFTDKIRDEIIDVADFATLVRSAVLTDFKTGAVDYVPSPEMPTRVVSQLLSLSSAFVAMKKARPEYDMMQNKEEFNQADADILYRVAMDSIPKKRRMALQALARYDGGVSSAGLATALNYPTETVKKWFAILNGLGICERIKRGGRLGDEWVMKDAFRKIVQRFDKIETVKGILQGEESDEDAFEAYLEAGDLAKVEEIQKDAAERAEQDERDINL